MTSFLVLYRGNTIADAKMVAVTIDPEIVASVAAGLLAGEGGAAEEDDPVLRSAGRGQRRALRLITTEAARAD